jgi:hypothetical protein
VKRLLVALAIVLGLVVGVVGCGPAKTSSPVEPTKPKTS